MKILLTTLTMVSLAIALTTSAHALTPKEEFKHTAMVWAMSPFCTYSASDSDLESHKDKLGEQMGWSQEKTDSEWSRETNKIISASTGNVDPWCRKVGQVMRDFYDNDFDSRMLD